MPTLKTFQQDGIIKTMVTANARSGCKSDGIRLRIFTGDVFSAHHRFATLPSNSPLSKGNIRRRTCSIRSSGVGAGETFDGAYLKKGSHRT
mmetsp:Transcript_17231/g.35558  ORF Transcript_17231/g.35558 Transcript_17231/m.35558 type:complete len:91 (-) Transcript_17231:881-1153(-)